MFGDVDNESMRRFEAVDRNECLKTIRKAMEIEHEVLSGIDDELAMILAAITNELMNCLPLEIDPIIFGEAVINAMKSALVMSEARRRLKAPIKLEMFPIAPEVTFSNITEEQERYLYNGNDN